MRLLVPRLAALAACLVLHMVTLSASAVSTEHTSQASRPRVDVLDGGRVVVSLDLQGDLKGIVSFHFDCNPDGTCSGDWAAKIAYADSTDPETGEEPHHDHDADGADAPHKDFLRLVDRGALSGTIESASLTFDQNGALTAMTVPLSITAGTREFTDAAGGSGSASLSALTLVF